MTHIAQIAQKDLLYFLFDFIFVPLKHSWGRGEFHSENYYRILYRGIDRYSAVIYF